MGMGLEPTSLALSNAKGHNYSKVLYQKPQLKSMGMAYTHIHVHVYNAKCQLEVNGVKVPP